MKLMHLLGLSLPGACVITAIVMLIIAIPACIFAYKWIEKSRLGKDKEKSVSILEEARAEAKNLRKEAELSAKEEIQKLKEECDAELKERRAELSRQENRIIQREDFINKKEEQLEKKNDAIELQKQTLIDKEAKINKKIEEQDEIAQKNVDGTRANIKINS